MTTPLAAMEKFETGVAPTWCAGCGDFAVWRAMKAALVQLKREPHDTVVVYGVGCAGNMADKLRVYGFHGLHGRSLPVATGVKLVRPDLPVVALAGDGDAYGEGLNHLMHTARGNHDLSFIVHNNGVYGLTKGQAAPTTPEGTHTPTTPEGVPEHPLNPLAVALAAGATFVARAFAGDFDRLVATLVAAMQHRGFALIDILQPCVTYNHVNTYEFYRERIRAIDGRHDPTDLAAAQALAQEWEKSIPLGILYQHEDRPAFHEHLPWAKRTTMVPTAMHQRSVAGYLKDAF